MFELLRTVGPRSFTDGLDFGRPYIRGFAPIPPAPPAEVRESADAVRVLLDLPGYTPEDVAIVFENDQLTIRAERKVIPSEAESVLIQERSFGKVARTFTVNVPVDGERIEAAFAHGVLTVTLPKRAEAKPRKIEVKVK